ncbi:hypothetical protein HMPREF9413_2589 [Paenibacillus sp. HGF7]|nr:hypothetical protein HMPREF9413_2589 [Paenibacillus sp. HGF7]
MEPSRLQRAASSLRGLTEPSTGQQEAAETEIEQAYLRI